MSRRDRGPREKSRLQNDRPKGDRPKGGRGARPHRAAPKGDRVAGHRSGGKPPRFAEPRRERPAPVLAETKSEPQLPTRVQTVVVTADENNMRVDRFLEARFPGLSFSHIQRIVRKGELRVNGRRADSKDRLEEGQSVRIPPLRLDAPKTAGVLSEAAQKTLAALKEMTLYEDDDVLVLKSRPALRCRAAPAPRGTSTRCWR